MGFRVWGLGWKVQDRGVMVGDFVSGVGSAGLKV